jgi:hypothetical protein
LLSLPNRRGPLGYCFGLIFRNLLPLIGLHTPLGKQFRR